MWGRSPPPTPPGSGPLLIGKGTPESVHHVPEHVSTMSRVCTDLGAFGAVLTVAPSGAVLTMAPSAAPPTTGLLTPFSLSIGPFRELL